MKWICFVFNLKLNYTSEKTFPNYYVRFLNSIVYATTSWFPRVVQYYSIHDEKDLTVGKHKIRYNIIV